MRRNKQLLLIFVIFALVGFGIIIGGIAFYISDVNFKKTATETTAIITEISISRNRDGDVTHTTYVKFFVGGKVYNGILGEWRSGMAVGQDVTIYYDPDNPHIFHSGGVSIIALIMVPLGAIFFLIGFIPLCVQSRHKFHKNKLLTDGTRIMATLSDIVPGNVSLNGQLCRNLICEYKDDSTGNIYLFKSENIWANLPHLGEKKIPLIPVYVGYYDYSKYYVAVDEFFASIAENNNVIDYTGR